MQHLYVVMIEASTGMGAFDCLLLMALSLSELKSVQYLLLNIGLWRQG